MTKPTATFTETTSILLPKRNPPTQRNSSPIKHMHVQNVDENQRTKERTNSAPIRVHGAPRLQTPVRTNNHDNDQQLSPKRNQSIRRNFSSIKRMHVKNADENQRTK
jgi:hypothetical protein